MAIPVATYGTNPVVAEGVRNHLLPEYDLVHVSLSLDSALNELPDVFAGTLDGTPSSPIGSNASADAAARKVPRALVIGGYVPDEDFDKVKAAVVARAGPDVRFIAVRKENMMAAGATSPDPELICKILKEKLDNIK